MPAKPTGLRPQIHAPMICSCRPLPVSYKREQLMTCRPLGFDAPPSVWREGAREKLSREHRGSCCSSASAAAAWPSTAITARAVHSWPCYVALALSSRVSSPAYAAAHFLTQKRDLITGARAVQCWHCAAVRQRWHAARCHKHSLFPCAKYGVRQPPYKNPGLYLASRAASLGWRGMAPAHQRRHSDQA
jgi:hypothetical protein